MSILALFPARQRALALWRRHPREAVALAALASVAAIAATGVAFSSPSLGEISAERAEQAPPAPPPLLIRNLPPTEAEALNQKISFAGGPNPAAQPFKAANMSAATRASAVDCLASAVYYEAGSQDSDGQKAVAQVVLNRVRHPAFPSTVCGVVYQGSTRPTGCQFTFTCDGSLERRPDSAGWARAKRIAEAALDGGVFGAVGLATHYHANYVVPYWSATLAKNAVVGAHLFYRWAGGWGRADAFTQKYARQEPSSLALRAAALAAFESRPARSQAEQLANIPGADVEAAPNGRVNVRFRIAEARAAVEKATHQDYVEKVEASQNLRWTLSGAGTDPSQAPLGAKSEPKAPAAAN